MKAEPEEGGRLTPRALWWLFVVLTLVWLGSFALFPDLFFCVGVNHLGVWFLDTFAILASNDALSRGLDPFAPNALDYLHRPHVYSHWWLHLRDLGLTRAHNLWVGLALVLAFLAVALARLRPRVPGELLWYGVVFLSSPVLLALDRANNDLVVFILLAAVVPCLTSPRRPVRFLAAVPIAVAAGLKFYPAIAGLVLLAAPDARELRGRLLIAVGLLAIVGLSVAPDLARFGGLAPRADGLTSFGAVNLLEAAGLGGWRAAVAALAFAAVAVGGFLRARVFDGWHPAPADRSAWLGFVLGSALLAGCFFTGSNYAYRWIFAAWMAPLLWSLPRDPAAPAGVRRLAGLTAGLLVFVLWSDALASAVLARFMGQIPAAELVGWADGFFLIEQPIVWVFFTCLLGFLTHFGREGIRTLFVHD